MSVESLNILITTSIGNECLQQIATTSPKIKATDVSDFLHTEQSGDLASKEKLDVLLAEAEVIFGFDLPHNVINRAPRLKWVQAITSGVEHLLTTGILGSSVIVTNIKGVIDTPIAEFVFGLVLMFVKQLPLCFQLKQEKQWQKFPTSALGSKTIGILGLGSIGREVARLAKAFDMRVIAIRNSVLRISGARNVDMMLPRDRLHQLLSESDFVVLALPLTPKTNKLIGEEELRIMRSTAYLINIARGNVIDEEALIHALDENWIAGAGLDVFATEPLPTDSKLWEFPNVILSPHVAGDTEDEIMQATELFIKNLRRYLDRNKLLNVVDKKRGY